MALIKKPCCRFWMYQCSVGGKKWIRSTGCADRAKAEAKIPKLQKLAELHRKQPSGFLRLKNAIVQEVDRIEIDVSKSEAVRMSYALGNFFEFVGDVALEKVDEAVLREFMRKRIKDKASRSTINRELCAVVRMLRENGFIVAKPTVKQGAKGRHRPFTEGELQLFFTHCEPEHRVLFMAMLLTGARPAELLPSPRSQHIALLKEEVDPSRDEIRLRTAKLKAGQEEKVRVIRVPETFMEALVDYARTIPGDHVFPPNQSLHNLFDRILKRAGIRKADALGKKLTAHSFRHTFATRMAERLGNNAFILKEVMGHSKITTTEIYCQPQAPSLVMEMPDLGGRVVEKGWWKKGKAVSCETA